MKHFFSIFLIALCTLMVFHHPLQASSKSEKYLKGRIPKKDKRYASFLLSLELLEKTQARILVETGTARGGNSNFIGDGGATILFGDWAAHNDATLYSVDINSEALEKARDATLPFEEHIEFVVSDSIKFLKNFSIPIDFLYLDSYDFDFQNPTPSQEHHLKEIVAAYPLLHDKTVVMIDDCDLPHGGKGKLIIEYLLSQGWKILYSGYQVILVQGSFE